MEQFFEYKKHYQYLTACMLNVTDSCNLKCRYCFVE
jgi:molybdenum cofactor biosynthesis enzyme MoaA